MSEALQEGQKLWWVGAHRHNKGPAEVIVTKIGRKWVQIDNGYRLDRETLWADGAGYSPPGRCWISQSIWEADQQRQKLWEKLCSSLNQFRMPPGIRTDQIERAAAALGISLADGQSEGK